MASAIGKRGRFGGVAVAATLGCACLPVAAEMPLRSYAAQGYTPALVRHLRMREGVSGAEVRYFNTVMTGGQHCVTTPNDTVDCLNWDGLLSAFEVAYEGVTEPALRELQKGVVAAVLAVCPSAKGPALDPDAAQQIAPGLFRLVASCPEIDARGM